MKKILLIIMAAMVMVSLVACKGNGDVNKTPVPTDKENPNQTDSQEEPSKEQTSIKDSLELLNNVWKSYDDKDKFAAAGGDSTEQNMTMDGPGKFGVEDAEMLNSTLGFQLRLSIRLTTRFAYAYDECKYIYLRCVPCKKCGGCFSTHHRD